MENSLLRFLFHFSYILMHNIFVTLSGLSISQCYVGQKVCVSYCGSGVGKDQQTGRQ